MSTLVKSKVAQAGAILRELSVPAWLTFARETTESGDPVLPLILGHPVTWQSAFLLTADGRSVAIVGQYEDEAVRSTGAWDEVIPYVQGIRDPLRETLASIDPAGIAINWSTDDVKADGLSHGMYRLLLEHLDGTPYPDRMIGAGEVIRRLRGRKTDVEIERIRTAIRTAEDCFDELVAHVGIGMSELEISTFMHERARARDVGLAWEASQCPIVTTGPESMVGHGLPSAHLAVSAGSILHLDFGVRQDEYCSDLQRAWYVTAPGETTPPAEVQRGFDTVVSAIQAAADVLAPGVPGWKVDQAARSVIVDAGYDEYRHATGHHVGRAAHDGAGVLGPRWERYGRTPEFPAEPGNVFTLELGIDKLAGLGYLGLEEMVLVTDAGCEWLSRPQKTLPVLELV